jgi:hypothetical protein
MASTPSHLLQAACHCGRIQIQLPSRPAFVKECRCSVCYKYGALWAYFPRRDVVITVSEVAKLQKYVRSDAGADGDISFNRCSHCGCMVCWFGEVVPPGGFDGPERMAVNCRMLSHPEVLEEVEVRVQLSLGGRGN